MMRSRPAFRILALAALAALAALFEPAIATEIRWRNWDAEFDENAKPWKEIEVQIPAYPRPENLLLFEGGGGSPHRFFIDARSLSVGDDAVVRYVLVIRSAGGATNVTFEGIRCSERELKVYALGRADGSWARARDPRWRRIEHQERNNHHGVLYGDYVCNRDSPGDALSIREMVQRLKHGPPRVYTQ